ncbi:threonine aldolase [Penicillium diatomitis]|uniref:Threonine aldolase n=1 Tax=Penicillium diatomitis TaxID=2819901 RepID=A0A9W9X5S9_9EURO|nr:threonine aldolase [Penicillium diatomitis]KAJ5484699.1 threonine aldolase [Penicillium diatomitis]
MLMLDALLNATFDDDVFREDSSTLQLEAAVAQMAGCEDACFALTGTMANQIALRVLFEQPPYALLTDKRAHILNYEAGGTAYLTGAMVQAVAPSNNLFLTLEDIKPRATITEDVQKAPTKVISLENTAHGAITPLAEMRRISAWARQHGIKLHLDGARLFQAVATGAGSVSDFCALFDTIHVDFSKNLGAPIGTMVLGSRDIITRARRVRKALGGGLRPTGLICAMMRAAVEENFGWEGRGELAHGMRRSHAMAKRLGTEWQQRGGHLIRPVETNIVWLDIRAAGYIAETFAAVGAKYGVKLDGGRLVVHYQMTEDSVQRMLQVFDECFAISKARL